MTPTELPDETYTGVQKLCAAGDAAAGRGDFDEAIGLYKRALKLLPTPVTKWDAATWIYTAIGDAYFASKNLPAALDAFDDAMRSPNAIGNPFLHLRRGQVLFDMGRKQSAGDELARAYMAEGDQIFESEDPKYLTFLRSILRPSQK